MTFRSLALAAALAIGGPAFAGGPLTVVSTTPTARSLDAAPNGTIAVEFDRPVQPASFDSDSFWAFGRWSGTATGAISFSPDGRTAMLTPNEWFSAGETVSVVLSHDLRGADGSSLRPEGYSFQFWTRAGRASMTFEEVNTLTTRSDPEVSTRSYGGIGSDLNGDRFLDITVVNEDSADLRVLLNRGIGDGQFLPFTEPTFPIGQQASPSEPADFNRDGHVDICVANIAVDTVSILHGNGDGTFAPQQIVNVGDAPRGIAVLDVDGDGDIDIVNTNAGGSGNLSVLINDGNGVFGPPTFFDTTTGSGERSLAAADMNEDGILDLVIGAFGNQRIFVYAGNGDATFTQTGFAPSGGGTWMLVCGDVNGDGHEDVATANSTHNNGAIILGNGLGGLGAPVTHPTDPFPLATDLGDLDGDGDLDWVNSSFNGDWSVFRNNGSGNFTFDQELLAPIAASCSVPMDIDNDGDLDLALIDELADVVIVMRNLPVACPADVDGSGDVGFGDILSIIGAWGDCPACPEDVNGDGVANFADVLAVIGQWGPC
ncbi:MAG: hypothetical protein GY715_20570 [Planctomycetes bacterium]|nr:hypothetical protein [Planctomycetota bacterium]